MWDGPDFSRGERQARVIWTRVYTHHHRREEGAGNWEGKMGCKECVLRSPLSKERCPIDESRSPILMGPQGLQHGAFSGAVNVVISFQNCSHLRGKTACGCSLPRATPTPGMAQELGEKHTEVRADYDSCPVSFGVEGHRALSLAWESESVLLELTNSYFGARGIKQNSRGECPLPDSVHMISGVARETA